MDIAQKTLQLKQDFDDVYEAGKKAGTVNEWDYDEFWDNLQQNGTRPHYAYAFSYTGWNDAIYNPKYPIAVSHVEGIGNAFVWNQQLTNTKVPISVTNGKMNAAFGNTALKKIPSLEVNGVTNFSNAFQNCKYLEEMNLSGVIDINGFDIHWSTKLSADSLASIVNALSADTTGLAVTLPTTAQANYDAVYGEGSWDILVATKPNWSIAYA